MTIGKHMKKETKPVEQTDNKKLMNTDQPVIKKKPHGKGAPPGGYPGGGRPAGSLNKGTKEIKELAKEYTGLALLTLVTVMQESDKDAAKVAAAKEILDRAYGKSTQAVEMSGAIGFAPINMPALDKKD